MEGCFLLHLELIFSREPQLMSGSSELSASIGGIWQEEVGEKLLTVLRVHTGILRI